MKIGIAVMILCSCLGASGQIAPIEPSKKPISLRQFMRQPTERALLTSMALAMTADAVTTQHVFQRQPGSEETNPLVRSLVIRGWPGQITASGIAFTSAASAAWLLERHGHKRIARAVLIAATIGSALAAKHNAGEYR